MTAATTLDGGGEAKRPNGRATRISSWICLGMGLLAAGVGGALWQSERAFRARAVEAEGTVLSLERRESRDNQGQVSVTYAPVFRFATPDGREHRVVSSTASSTPGVAAGAAVRVRYDPERPTRAAIIDGGGAWIAAVVPGLFAAGFAGFGAFGLRRARRLDALSRVGRWEEAEVVGVRHFIAYATESDDKDELCWVIQARWTDAATGASRVFEGDPLPEDPTPRLPPGARVRVFLDPADPGGEFVLDQSFVERGRGLSGR